MLDIYLAGKESDVTQHELGKNLAWPCQECTPTGEVVHENIYPELLGAGVKDTAPVYPVHLIHELHRTGAALQREGIYLEVMAGAAHHLFNRVSWMVRGRDNIVETAALPPYDP